MRGNKPSASLALALCLLLFAALAQAARQPGPEFEGKEQKAQPPAWRVIDNAPYGVTPAHPPLVPEGEQFPDVQALIGNIEGRAGVNAVAFSPDGRFLASGSRDDTVELLGPGAPGARAQLRGAHRIG